MKLHRIFIAINLPDEIKGQLLVYKEKWSELPARWLSKENLHLTLVFLGNRSDQELAEVCRLLRKAGERHSPFQVKITNLRYGPDEKLPRMIWALVERSSELIALQKDVEQTLSLSGLYTSERRLYSSHLTLARLSMIDFKEIEPEERPHIHEEISLSFQVKSIEIMESVLKRSGAEYSICQSIPLGVQ